MSGIEAIVERLRRCAHADQPSAVARILDGLTAAQRPAVAKAVLTEVTDTPLPTWNLLVAGLAAGAEAYAALARIDDVEVRFGIACARGPGFLAPWTEHLCTGMDRWGFGNTWLLVWQLVRDGQVREPGHLGYRLGLLTVLNVVDDLAAVLRADPELLGKPLTTLFELEGTRELSFANIDKYAKGGRSWQATLLELVRTGDLDRDRLLDLALAALMRDFPAYRAGWFARLHDALEPTAEERARRLRTYLQLCASRVPQVQSFAVQALGKAAAMGARLPRTALADLEPAWLARQRGVVRAALRLASGLAAAEPSDREVVAAAMAQALANPDGDAQAAAWQALCALDLPRPRLEALVAPHRAALVPVVRARVARLLGEPVGKGSGRERAATPASPAPGDDRVVPIADLDELVRELSALLLGATEPLVAERCLDGQCRLGAQRPDDFDRRTAALRRLARREPRSHFEAFVLSWLDRADYRPNWDAWVERLNPGWQSWHLRLAELAPLLRAGIALPLLALPTHAPAWIEPKVLHERLAAWRRAGVQPAGSDLERALARLRARDARTVRVAQGLDEAATRRGLAAPVATTLRFWREPRRTRDGVRWFRQHGAATFAGKVGDHPLDLWIHRCGENGWDQSGESWYPNESETLLHLRSLTRLCPHATESLFTLACLRITPNIDGGTVARHDIAFVEPLLLATTVPGPAAWSLLALTLGAKAPELHGIAVDAAVQLLGDGRMDAAALGDALHALFAARLLPCRRWATTLRTFAGHGAAAATVVHDVLTRAVHGDAADLPKDLGDLLALWLDLRHELGRAVTGSSARSFLNAVQQHGGGRAARVAGELLA